MKTRTIGELSQSLRSDLGWRRKENSSYYSMILNAIGTKRNSILRGAVALLYAHWEGFVNNSCRSYFDYVKIRSLHHNEMASPFLSIAIKMRLKSVAESGLLDSHLEFTNWLRDEWNRRGKLPKSEDIIGTSNLTSVVFKSYICGLSLPYRESYQIGEKPIIDALVTQRNGIAHGEWYVVDEVVYIEIYKKIEEFMEAVCEDIEDAAARQSFAIP